VLPLLQWEKKSIIITHSECVTVALGIQHAERMSRIISPTVANPFVQYLSTLSHKGKFSEEKSY
jgi:hypothetical protein